MKIRLISSLSLVMAMMMCMPQLHAAEARTLVAYYSFTGNVRTIVNQLSQQLDADVIEIEPAEEGLDYAANNYAIGSALIGGIREHPDDPSSYPAIKPVRIDLSNYDNIIVAAPLWWSQMAAPMQSFLFQYGSMMQDKNISLIVSSASSGISGVVSDAKRLIPRGRFINDNLWIRSSQTSQAATLVAQWLGGLTLDEPSSDSDMRIRVSDGTHTVVFALNETSAAQSLYDMLPLSVEVNNYGNNEKIFYPPTTITFGDDCIEGDCPAGTLALFSPWGNVVMYYGAASRYSGLYILGTAIEGAEAIGSLSGTITVEKVTATSPIKGDVNADGKVDVSDVNEVINIILKV